MGGCRRRRRQQPPIIATFDDPSAVAVLPPLCLLPVGCPAIVCGGHCCRGERVNNHSATRYTLQGAYSSSQWDRSLILVGVRRLGARGGQSTLGLGRLMGESMWWEMFVVFGASECSP